MLEVEPAGQRNRIRPPEVAETATKTSPAPLQKHSLDGCTIDMPSFAARYLVTRPFVCRQTDRRQDIPSPDSRQFVCQSHLCFTYWPSTVFIAQTRSFTRQ